jgi:hypothetical protein
MQLHPVLDLAAPLALASACGPLPGGSLAGERAELRADSAGSVLLRLDRRTPTLPQ